MGKMNLLKANWTGKVGETVGAKWKNLSTIRTYTKPAYSDTPAQQLIRTNFTFLTKLIASFSDMLKPYSALDTKSMSVRNAIIKLNKDLIQQPTEIRPDDISISRGGLPSPVAGANAWDPGTKTLTVNWTPASGPTVSLKAKTVVVTVQHLPSGDWFASVSAVPIATTTLDVILPSNTFDCWGWLYTLDYRGSSRVGSRSSNQHWDP